MSERLIDDATKRFGQAEVYRVRSESHPVSFENNRLKELMRRDSAGVALRVVSDGRVGFSSTTNPEREGELVDRAGALARYGSEAKFEFPAAVADPEMETFDDAVQNLSDSDLIDTGNRLMDRLRSDWPDLLCDVRLGRSWGETEIVNSAGLHKAHRSSSYHVYLGGQLIRGTDMLNVWAGHSSYAVFGEEEEERILQTVLRALDWSRNLAEPPRGDVPVIFTPRGVSATLLSPLLSGFNGRNIVTGASPIIGKEGRKMVDSRITVVDDPLTGLASGSRPFDDEGVPSRRVTLIENGVIGEPVFDLQTAGQAGRTSTGSAHRGLASTPGPGVSVVHIAAGGDDDTSLLDGVKEGLVVEELLGAGQGNELGGDFRANISLGYKVENGEIVGRVKDTMISGNVYKVLDSVEAIGSESEWVFGSLKAPAIRCRGVEVAGAG